jgi:hypothetical protein
MILHAFDESAARAKIKRGGDACGEVEQSARGGSNFEQVGR